jgi:hypothetical protein
MPGIMAANVFALRQPQVAKTAAAGVRQDTLAASAPRPYLLKS